MKVPVVRGTIERRLLVNYRLDPAALAGILPAPFRPKLVGGHAMAGICLIRLANIRPRGLPAGLGIGSENAAHRIAVQWEENGAARDGVYIPRRDTDSRLNTFFGGRIFPGVHHRARFTIRETADRFDVALESADGDTRVEVVGRLARALPAGSVFPAVEDASAFFESGSVGYSPERRPGLYDGLELRTDRWSVQPLAVEHVVSSFFDDPDRFPPGAAAFDCALVMRDVSHEWHSSPSLADGAGPEHDGR